MFKRAALFETSGEFNKNSEGYVVGWLFNDVDITTASSNLLKISASDWGLTSLQESTFNNGTTFNSITLTDASVSVGLFAARSGSLQRFRGYCRG